MNILFLVSSLTGGGAERVCASIANGLSRKGHSVTILVGKTTDKDYYTEPSVKVVTWIKKDYISFLSKVWREIKKPFLFSGYLYSVISEQKVDVVINILGMYMTESIIISRLCGAKIVFSDHNAYERPQDSPMKLRQKRHKFYESRFCDCTTVLTNRDKDILKNRRNVVVMPNPLFFPILNDLPAKEKIVLAVGRLDAWHYKGFDLLIRAWGEICHKHPDWRLRIIGNGTELSLNKLGAFVSESRAERVEIKPFTKDIIQEYGNSEIFVLSSRYEAFGLVLFEAMSQKCACIACDYLGRQSDIITDGLDGLLCETYNADALALKIDQLINDNSLRLSLQTHSTDNLNRFSETNITLQWESLLYSLLR